MTILSIMKEPKILELLKNLIGENKELYISNDIDYLNKFSSYEKILELIENKNFNKIYYLDKNIIEIIISNDNINNKIEMLLNYYTNIVNEFKFLIKNNINYFNEIFSINEINVKNIEENIELILHKMNLITKNKTIKTGAYFSQLKLIFILKNEENLKTFMELLKKYKNTKFNNLNDLKIFLNSFKLLNLNDTKLNNYLQNIFKYKKIKTELQEFIQSIFILGIINSKNLIILNNKNDLKNIIENNKNNIFFTREDKIINKYIENVLNNYDNIKYKNWIKSGIIHGQILNSILDKNETYLIYSQKEFFSNELQKHIKKLINNTFNFNTNFNKWNPADIYIFPKKYEKDIKEEINNFLEIEDINELKLSFISFLEKYNIIPYSLKLVDTPKYHLKFYNIHEYNIKNLKINKINLFTKKKNSYNKTVSIELSNKIIFVLRTFDNKSNFALEILKKGSSSRHGKISDFNILNIIKKYTNDEKKFEIMKKRYFLILSKNNDKIFINEIKKLLLKLEKLAKERNIKLQNDIKTNEINDYYLSSDFIYSKYKSLFLINLILMNKNYMEIIYEIYNYASSEMDFSTPYLKLEDSYSNDEIFKEYSFFIKNINNKDNNFKFFSSLQNKYFKNYFLNENKINNDIIQFLK